MQLLCACACLRVCVCVCVCVCVYTHTEAEKGNFYVSAVRSSTSAAKRGPTAWNFTAKLYLRGETNPPCSSTH